MQLYNKIDKNVLREQVEQDPRSRSTISFYQYAHIANPQLFRDHLYILLDEIEVLGRIYVSSEGINAQISIPEENTAQLTTALNTITFLTDIRLNKAIEDDGKSFYKLVIKLRHKIVADGLDDETFDVTNKGVHLSAQAFNDLTNQEDTVIVDMRNHYESEVGHFKGAITPDVETFRESLPIISDMLEEHKDKNIVMYCTGGIRCEKASAYLKHKGYENVHQLEGGIIEYTRQAKLQGLENKFIGKNFVFDDRLGERITEDIISKCHQCGAPSDDHTNCANDACHILFIQCPSCAKKMEHTCSDKCQEFNRQPVEEREALKGKMTFNGTKFGKGRYKAYRQKEGWEK